MTSKVIDSYLNELKARNLAEGTIESYKQTLSRLNEYKPIDLVAKEDLISFFNDLKCADSTRQLYAVILKTYFKSQDKEQVASWLQVKKQKETLRHDDILTADDVNSMINATDSAYWKCLLALLYESGARINELLTLKYSDFVETDKGLVLTITTHKTGAGFRRMIIPLTANYFFNLKDSIAHDKGSLVFAIGKKNPKTLYRWAFEVILEIGRRAKVSKPCNPHAFRHARATDEVRKGTQEAIIRKKLGWSSNSMMIARYQHLNDDDVINSQIDGTHIMKRSELKIAEKADITPIYESLQKENIELKVRLERLEFYLLGEKVKDKQVSFGLIQDEYEAVKQIENKA
jgi:integrase